MRQTPRPISRLKCAQQWDFNGSQVPPEWHAWLNGIRKDPPHEDPIMQQSHQKWMSTSWENLTGTRGAYKSYSTTGKEYEQGSADCMFADILFCSGSSQATGLGAKGHAATVKNPQAAHVHSLHPLLHYPHFGCFPHTYTNVKYLSGRAELFA